MLNLHTRLDELAGPPAAPSADTVDADLSRGRRALRRRRTGQVAAGSGFAVAAVLAASLALPAFFSNDGTIPDAVGGGDSVVVTELVAYTGEQPSGYTLGYVPEGWEVSRADRNGLGLAPVGTDEPEPWSCIDRICVFLQGFLPDLPITEVQVGDRTGALVTMLGDDAETLFVEQPSGDYLTIQIWRGLNWSEKEIIEFAAGIEVHDDALVSQG